MIGALYSLILGKQVQSDRSVYSDINTYILEDFLTHHNNFAIFSQTVNAIEKLLAAFNVQLKIGMNQS